jgi:hypothetical protein
LYLRLFVFLVFIFSPLFTFSQNKITVSGFVSNAKNGETLIGANIYITKLKTGTVTNEYGFYYLEIEIVFFCEVWFTFKFSVQCQLHKNVSIRSFSF